MVQRSGRVSRLLAAALLLALASAAHATYNDECRTLAERLDANPAALKVGELDLLKSCLSDLQRIIVLGDTPPEKKPPQTCPEPPPAPACPVCKVCPVAEAAPAAGRDKKRDREEDRSLRPYLPQY